MENRIKFLLVIVFGILLIPFIAMQLTDDVVWSFVDFLIAGLIIFSCLWIIDFILRKPYAFAMRFLIIFLIVVIFFIIWIELAVGLFD